MKNTIQRQIILNAVGELDIHATAEQVYDHVHESQPSISKATVYRNLSKMAEAGELLNIGTFYGATHYDHNTHKHYHFVCEDCKQVFDVDANFSDIMNNVQKTDEIDITNFHISFSGLCRGCKAIGA